MRLRKRQEGGAGEEAQGEKSSERKGSRGGEAPKTRGCPPRVVFTSKEGTALGCYLVPAARPSEISTQPGREPLLCPRRARATPERGTETQSSQRGGRSHSLPREGGRAIGSQGRSLGALCLRENSGVASVKNACRGLGGWERHPPPNPQEWVGAGARGIKTNKPTNKPL